MIAGENKPSIQTATWISLADMFFLREFIRNIRLLWYGCFMKHSSVMESDNDIL